MNTVICRVYVHRRKELMDKGQRKFGFPFNLGDLLSHTIHLRRLCELLLLVLALVFPLERKERMTAPVIEWRREEIMTVSVIKWRREDMTAPPVLEP